MLRSASLKKPVAKTTSRPNSLFNSKTNRSFTSFNRATLIGKVGFDPKEFEFDNGVKKVSLVVFTSFRALKDGEPKTMYSSHHVSAVKGAVEPASLLQKGDLVFVEGILTQRRFIDNVGKTKYSTTIQAKQSSNIKRLGIAEAQNMARESDFEHDEHVNEEEEEDYE